MDTEPDTGPENPVTVDYDDLEHLFDLACLTEDLDDNEAAALDRIAALIADTRLHDPGTIMAIGDWRTNGELIAEALHAAKAVVVLSGYPSALYDQDLYADWHRTEAEITLRAGNGRKSALGTAVEVLWSNRPFPTAPGGVQLTFAEATS